MPAPNPLSRLFAAATGPAARPVAFDAADKYLILFTGRSGSTLLSRLISATELAGNPEEFFTEAYIPLRLKRSGPRTFDQYLDDLVRDHSSNNLFGFEINPPRLAWLSGFPAFEPAELLDGRMPVIWLTRNDIVGQSYSFALARHSGRWHDFGGGAGPETEQAAPFRPSDEELWRHMLQILDHEHWAESCFLRFGTHPLRISYEALRTEALRTLAVVLLHAGVPLASIPDQLPQTTSAPSKLAYTGREQRLNEFFADHGELLIEIAELRRQSRPIPEVIDAMSRAGVPAPPVKPTPLPRGPRSGSGPSPRGKQRSRLFSRKFPDV